MLSVSDDVRQMWLMRGYEGRFQIGIRVEVSIRRTPWQSVCTVGWIVAVRDAETALILTARRTIRSSPRKDDGVERESSPCTLMARVLWCNPTALGGCRTTAPVREPGGPRWK